MKLNKYEKLFLDLINYVEFDLEKDKLGYWVYDTQGANLGDIESDRFDNASSIIDRMNIYFDDYLVASVVDNDISNMNIDWEDIDNYIAKMHYDTKGDYEKLLIYLEDNYKDNWTIPYLDLMCRNYDKVNINKCWKSLNKKETELNDRKEYYIKDHNDMIDYGNMSADEIAYERYKNGMYTYNEYCEVCSIEECKPLQKI